MANSNISGGKIELRFKQWICNTPFIHSLITNPFIISILILTVIWLLDILYGKTFEEASNREIIQHSTTVLAVMIAGIFLNNLAITKCNSIKGGSNNYESQLSHNESYSDHHSRQDNYSIAPIDKYDEVLSRYE